MDIKMIKGDIIYLEVGSRITDLYKKGVAEFIMMKVYKKG